MQIYCSTMLKGTRLKYQTPKQKRNSGKFWLRMKTKQRSSEHQGLDSRSRTGSCVCKNQELTPL